MQFLITAYDGLGMLEKRMAVRPRHLENISRVKGKILCAGEMQQAPKAPEKKPARGIELPGLFFMPCFR